MLNKVTRYLRCPHCAGSLDLRNRALACADGHSFDVAKQGYVNLLTGTVKLSADTREMVDARAEFLAEGHYEGLAEAVAELSRKTVDPSLPGCVVDVGGGTGYYLARVLDELPDSEGVLLDISKFAARRAARAHPRIGAVVADAWQSLPLHDDSVSLVLNVFAPRNAADVRRVLDPQGVLLVVTPRHDHLQELVGTVGLMRVDQRKEERLAERLAPHFSPAESRPLTTTMTLGHRAMNLLVGMGPNAWHQEPSGLLERIGRLPERCDVTVSVMVTAYRPLP
ncbi:putative RNA methyltransferase [Streptomyces sp. S.PNR 29]|uniref:putative RNA methyltransferase n=1 Tax=Streptomyces sp. S.PNR 29 TaxID=2973805 RepID=UPI0025B27442|nr:methyltransferase domain-containing protein [Streptomyces sp. S.PNR 29]MDN0197911.1 methyltransferase domain-containing protein [Streptomyces sp. S.PNR 29]